VTLGIANARGVPGTAAALVTGPRRERMLLACHHVVFGHGARAGERVWAIPPEHGEPVALGRASGGVLGRVGPSTDPHFIDCALVELDREGDYPMWLHTALEQLVREAPALASVGSAVVKNGATTGVTHGTILDDCYVTEPWLESKAWTATDQLLIDSADDALVFSAHGDSGAAVLDNNGRVVGLLWGTTPAGQGIACRIEPVLEHLGVEL
jgi:hypothetical protein